jgi:hypothetical protein
MKTFVSHSFVKCALVLAFSCWGARAETQTNAAAKFAPALIKSEFVADGKVGRDPFFPNSTRGREVIPQVIPTNATPQPSLVGLNELALKGISGPIGQRLALINSSTVGIGELAEIRCGRKLIKIRCLEIRDSSVLIALVSTGETRELKLRDSI